MPHGLSTASQKVEMMYVGDAPWHRLGTRLNGPATAEDAIKAAHLDWEVGKTRLYIKSGRRYKGLEDRFAITRNDLPNCPPLGIVGKTYQPLQNRDAFRWFDSIVGENAAIYHTAGALGHGERIWILAKLPGEIRVKGEDVTEKFLLLSNSHDGESSVQVKFTPIRVVCQNTLTMALSRGRTLKMTHNRSLGEALDAAKTNLGIITDRFTQIANDFTAMAEVQMTGDKLDSYLSEVFPLPEDVKNDAGRKRVAFAREKSKELFETGKGNDMGAVRRTLWTAYNGVAEYIDHVSARSLPNRLENIWFSTGYLTKAKAFRVAMEKVKEWRN